MQLSGIDGKLAACGRVTAEAGLSPTAARLLNSYRCLLHTLGNEEIFVIHILLQDMGRQPVFQEFEQLVGNRLIAQVGFGTEFDHF